MTGHEGKEVTGSVQYCAINKSPCGKATMTGHEGKEVIGSLQYCAVNKSRCGKASMTGDEGKEVTGSLQYCAVNKSRCGKASMTDTLALATGTRVGASDHAIGIMLYFEMARVLGILYFDTFTLIVVNCAHEQTIVYVVI